MLLIICLISLSAADKHVNNLKEFDLAFDTFAEWLNADEARVISLSTSVSSSVDDARDGLDASRACLEELLQKQQDLDSLATMAKALHHDGISSSRTMFQLSSSYLLTTKKLKVNMLVTWL